MSAKRRRSVGVEKSIIRALKVEAEKCGERTHTTLVTKIFIGERPPISFSIHEREGNKGVSMKESLWLAIKIRAKHRGMSATHAAEMIILGDDACLSISEIEEGEKMARANEASRASPTMIEKDEADEPEIEDKIEEPTPEQADVQEETLAEEEDRRKRQARLPKGVPMEGVNIEKRSAFKILNIEEEQHFGGVYSL